MDFYHIKDDYISFLRQYDCKVAENKRESRPYVGIVLTIDSIQYYAPFTLPKNKHQRMKNSIDFRRIQNGQLGAINFNNMIPVPDEALIPISIVSVADEKYRRLLQNQYNFIRSDWNNIIACAKKLHTLIVSQTKLSEHEKEVKIRCCDLVLLESVFGNYQPKN